MPAGLAKLHSVHPEIFSGEKKILCKRNSVANHFQTVHEKRSEE